MADHTHEDDDLYELFANATPRQLFPAYYPDSTEFLVNNRNPGGAVGATAKLNIELDNNPFMCTGFRITNVYEIPEAFRTVDLMTWLSRVDGDQTVESKLTQQNFIIRPMNQRLLTGSPPAAQSGAVHWHPLESPIPFRGGNNVNLIVTRQTSYPEEFESIICEAAAVGWLYMSDAVPAKGPPSTGYPT